MKKLWNKLSDLSRFYAVSMISFMFFWMLLYLGNIAFINIMFFITAFVWHFALLTPGLKEKVFVKNQNFSFISVVVKFNYYLQIFIKMKNSVWGPPIVRTISPLFFTILLVLAGGNGDVFYTLVGSAAFEATYFIANRKTISAPPSDLKTPEVTENAESFHE